MGSVLHLLKSGADPVTLTTIERQSRAPGTTVIVVLLHDAPQPSLPSGITVHRLSGNSSAAGTLNDSELLDLIFSSDQVITW